MNRFFLVCALAGLCAVGCTKVADPVVTQNANKPAVVIASPSATASPAEQPSQKANANTEKTGTDSKSDVTGAYTAIGTLPKDFSEIELLNLATIDENGKPAPFNGFIRPKRRSAKDYQLVNPKLEGKNLTFTSIAVNGVSYGFTGAFERLGNFSEDPPPYDEAILKGTLTKMVDGKVVAETKVNFAYSPGG